MIKVLAGICLLIILTSCASSKPDVEAVFYCRTKEWENVYRIFEDYKVKRCTESTRIRFGKLFLDPSDRMLDTCVQAIKKHSKKKNCCLIRKTKKYGKVNLPYCREGIID